MVVSKIVHEMFHGYQMSNNESRFPNELEALQKYRYIDDNLSIKYQESVLLVQLLQRFDRNTFDQLLAVKKYRYQNYPLEYEYEAKVEQIEGTANFVELMALKQLSKTAFEKN